MLNKNRRDSSLTLERDKEINLDEYDFHELKNESNPIFDSIDDLEKKDINSLESVGLLMKNNNRSGTYLLCGRDAFTITQNIEGLEILPIAEALEKYDWLKEKYWFKVLDKDQDKFTSTVASTLPKGYFIHLKKGVKVKQPFQAGLFMIKERSTMTVHNIVILEEDSELHLITGCTNKTNIRKGIHLAISEHFIGKNAKLINTMVHNWGPEFKIRPKSGTIVEEGGTYISNYCSLRPAKSIQMDPFTHLKGDNSSGKYTTIILGIKGTYANLGGKILMTGKNTGAEIASRAICKGGHIIQTGLIIGAAYNSRAHVDCSGMMMSEEGAIEAVPGLRALHPEAKMSHEASIGRISPGEVAYLQSKGFSEEEAVSMIIRGFLDIGINGLSPELDAAILEIAEISGHGEEDFDLIIK